ncbi:long-chain-fatty-acid--CoA ligase [Spirochaetota bacterium]
MKIVDGFPATTQDDYQLNVTNIIRHAARNFGNQEIASRQSNGTMFRYTYKDSYLRMMRLANALTRLGVKPGDRVGVLSWNTHQNFEIYYGLPGTGAVMLLLNLRLPADDLEHIINHGGAKYLIIDESLIDIAEEVAPRCESVEKFIIITDKPLDKINTNLTPLYSYEEILADGEPHYNWPIINERSSYAACYTTGTTGRPKGVYYSHRSVYLQALMYAHNALISSRDSVFQFVPMFHVLGWGTPQAVTASGAKLVLPGQFSLEELDELIHIHVKEKITISNGATAILIPMIEKIKKMKHKPQLHCCRILTGASEPPTAVMKEFHELTGADVIHTYGSTEAMAVATINLIKPWMEKELNDEKIWELKKKQGYVVTGLDAKIIDLNENILPNDGETAGELIIRGPWITESYFNSPGSENLFTKEGYWKSGDVGTLDREGYFKVTDRIKDVIKSGGEWISSIDMENEIIHHEAVIEAAVIGVEHPKWEERPLAVVVLRSEFENKIKKEDIIEVLSKKFARWQMPDDVIFVDSIPKTSVGKINKKAIRDEYKDIYKK